MELFKNEWVVAFSAAALWTLAVKHIGFLNNIFG